MLLLIYLFISVFASYVFRSFPYLYMFLYIYIYIYIYLSLYVFVSFVRYLLLSVHYFCLSLFMFVCLYACMSSVFLY